MPRVQKRDSYNPRSRKSGQSQFKPANNPDAREKQLVNLAINQIEKQLREGTAPTGVLVQLLKLSTEKERMERERLKAEVELTKAKAEGLNTSKDIKELYEKAINAMSAYSPSD